MPRRKALWTATKHALTPAAERKLPGCRRNLEYVRRQRERFEAGRTPPDFPPNDSECGFVGRGGVLDLSELGREMMGFDEASTSTTTGYR